MRKKGRCRRCDENLFRQNVISALTLTQHNTTHHNTQPFQVNYDERARIHHDLQSKRASNSQAKSLKQQRETLPAHNFQKAVVSVITSNQVTIVSGDTGCGKSTQVPQFLLDDPDVGPSCKIAVTQPRRISAISVAERVAQEVSKRAKRASLDEDEHTRDECAKLLQT